MIKKSLVLEAHQIHFASELIQLGARLQLLEAATTLSRERLLKLYKELKNVSPPKGMLPFSADWFLSWEPNIHSSLFMNIYQYLNQYAGIGGINAIMKAYQLYLEQIPSTYERDPVLSLMRAWTLVRFFESDLLTTAECSECGGHFVTHNLDLNSNYVCGLCHIPSRAGKTKRARELREQQAALSAALCTA